MAKKKIPEDVVKDTCPGYSEEECADCIHAKEPVELELRVGRKWGFITKEFLKQAIKRDNEDITGCFVKGCKFRQRIIRKTVNGEIKYILVRYLQRMPLYHSQMF